MLAHASFLLRLLIIESGILNKIFFIKWVYYLEAHINNYTLLQNTMH